MLGRRREAAAALLCLPKVARYHRLLSIPGVLSTEFHMQYIDYADPTVRRLQAYVARLHPHAPSLWPSHAPPMHLPHTSHAPPLHLPCTSLAPPMHLPCTSLAPQVRTAFRKPELVTTWEVVCSGFFDSVGLYSEVHFD